MLYQPYWTDESAIEHASTVTAMLHTDEADIVPPVGRLFNEFQQTVR
jgi:hypothetical protein